jgi:hypothetical protein
MNNVEARRAPAVPFRSWSLAFGYAENSLNF